MKPFLIALLLIATHFAHAEQTNRLTRSGTDVMKRAAEARGGAVQSGLFRHPLELGEHKTPVLVMEPLQSAALQDLFPTLTAYRLISSRDIIHSAHFSALLLDTNGLPSHLQTDDEVVRFLGMRTTKERVKSKEDALRFVRAFADLRSYRIVESPPSFPDVRKPEKQPPPVETDYKFMAEERKDHWRVYATFFTSEYSTSYERYVFTLYKPPGAGIDLAEPVLIRLRNYVY